MFEFVEREFSPDRAVYGIDEAGRGPLAGPLSLGLVQFTSQQLQEIETGTFLTGLGDSKKLTQKTRKRLQQVIEQECFFRQVFVSNASIDRFGLSYCIFRGIMKLTRGLRKENSVFLIDGNYKFEKFIEGRETFHYRSIIGGDTKVPSISAASIIAKERRDAYMRTLAESYPLYGFSSNMGYGTKQHRDSLLQYGVSKYHRKSFLKDIINSPLLFG